MDDNSSLYEINATLFLDRMSRKYGPSLTLATIPREEWHLISETGFDLVWLMGVWQRSPDAKNEAVFNPDLRRRYDEVLPGWGLDDIDGSPYAIYSYTLSKKLIHPGCNLVPNTSSKQVETILIRILIGFFLLMVEDILLMVAILISHHGRILYN